MAHMTAEASANAVVASATPSCVVASQDQLGEGACWSVAEQAFYWVDILGRRLQRFDPLTRTTQRWDFPAEISAVCERRAAPGLLVSLRHELALFDPARAAVGVQTLCQPEPERVGNRFNDGKCDAQGRFWAGSMDFATHAPSGALYRLDANGSCSRHEDGIAVTNGPTWSLDGRTMYFCDSAQALVYAYDFNPQAGSIENRRIWLRFAATDGAPDGMCTDSLGRIWIAHWCGGCVSCHDPISAVELARIALPVSQVTNCAFGGADLCTLYVTTARVGLGAEQLASEPLAGGVFAVCLEVAGLPAHKYAG
jgi:sugar lactone lactonase YvrE